MLETVLKDKLSNSFIYHNLQRTTQVAQVAIVLPQTEKRSDGNREVSANGHLVALRWLYQMP